jgi:hypothetical protein
VPKRSTSANPLHHQTMIEPYPRLMSNHRSFNGSAILSSLFVHASTAHILGHMPLSRMSGPGMQDVMAR